MTLRPSKHCSTGKRELKQGSYKSLCRNVQRHSCLEICHKRTVLSIEEDNKKLFLLQLRSKMSPVCPSNSRTGLDLKTGALKRSPPEVLEDTSSSCSWVCLSSGVEITAHTLTTWSRPAAARYLPSLLNSVDHTAPLVFGNFDNLCALLEFTSVVVNPGTFSSLAPCFVPLNSCAKNMRLNSRSFLLWARTLIYLGGSLCWGIKPFAPIEDEKT